MTTLKALALALVIAGALNLGVWGFYQIDVISLLFGGHTALGSRILYSLIGLAGIYSLTAFDLGRARAGHKCPAC